MQNELRAIGLAGTDSDSGKAQHSAPYFIEDVSEGMARQDPMPVHDVPPNASVEGGGQVTEDHGPGTQDPREVADVSPYRRRVTYL